MKESLKFYEMACSMQGIPRDAHHVLRIALGPSRGVLRILGHLPGA